MYLGRALPHRGQRAHNLKEKTHPIQETHSTTRPSPKSLGWTCHEISKENSLGLYFQSCLGNQNSPCHGMQFHFEKRETFLPKKDPSIDSEHLESCKNSIRRSGFVSLPLLTWKLKKYIHEDSMNSIYKYHESGFFGKTTPSWFNLFNLIFLSRHPSHPSVPTLSCRFSRDTWRFSVMSVREDLCLGDEVLLGRDFNVGKALSWDW